VQAAVNDAPASSAGIASNRICFLIIALLSLAGTIVSAFALERHFAKSATQFCEFGEKFNCDIVNRSQYSSIEGIPVAVIGIAGYAALFVLSTWGRSRPDTPNRLLGAAIAGLAFALYLTYIEAYVLTTWCILCLISLILIALICLLAVVVKLQSARA